MSSKRLLVLAGTLLWLVPSTAVGATLADDADPLGAAEQVDLGTDPSEPRVLEAGLWRTRLEPNPSDPLQFRYQRTSDDSTIHVSVTAVGGVRDGFVLRSDVDGQDCGNTNQAGAYDVSGAHLVIGSQIRVAGSLDSACLNAKAVDFELERATSAESGEQLPVVIKIVEETVLEDLYGVLNDNTDLPSPPESAPVFVPPVPGEVREVEPGAGFDAAVADGPGTYRATLVQGQNHFYAVDLDWGQSVAALVDVQPVPLPEGQTSLYGLDLTVQVLNPMRNDVDPTAADIDDGVALDAEAAVQATTGYGPITWLSRMSGTAMLPGTHWVVVSLEGQAESAETEPLGATYDLTLEVQGAREGVPAHKAVPGDAKGALPFLVGPDQRSGFASGHPVPTTEASGFWTARRFGALGLGGFGLVCLAAGAVWLRRA